MNQHRSPHTQQHAADSSSSNPAADAPSDPENPPRRPLTDAAKRALAEADERRRQAERTTGAAACPTEVGGQQGPDPVRYGDWEKGGICWDF